MKQLKLLLVEDSEDDALLLLRELRKSGYQLVYRCVETAADMSEALAQTPWDIVVSDYQMPQFSGLEALYLLNASALDIPFIIISGAIGEALAVEAMRAGANDYLMKDNLSRLVPAVERALREAQNRRQRALAEQQLEEMRLRLEGIIASAMDAIITVDREQKIIMFNHAAEGLFGFSAAEVMGREMSFLLPERYRGLHRSRVKEFGQTWQTTRNMNPGNFPVYGLRRGGEEFPIEASISQLEVKGEKVYTVIIRDITERMAGMQKLAEEKQRLELALLGGKLGMWDWTVPNNKVIMNEQWAVIMGYPAALQEETMDQILEGIHPQDVAAFNKAIEDFLLQPEGYIQHEYRVRNKAGDWRWVHTSGRVLEWDDAHKPFRIVGTHQDITDLRATNERLRKIEIEMLNLKIAEQHNQSNAFIRGQEEERRRLARELHDGIGQQLNVLKIQVSIEGASAAIRQSIDNIIADVVRINNNLMPLVLQDFGLEAAVRQLINKYKEVGKADFYYYCDLQGERFGQELEIAAYRIVQEATSNAIKYAGAENISVQLMKQDEQLLIMIEDDGRGFGPSENAGRPDKGFGLLNMQYRVKALRGTLFIESNPGQGCLVNVEIPINKE